MKTSYSHTTLKTIRPLITTWPIGLSYQRVRLALLFILGSLAYSNNLLPAAEQNVFSSFQASISSLINQPQFKSAFWGIQIVSLENNEILFTHNEQKRFLPASGMKLFITAAALDHWAADHRFQTPVFLEGFLDRQGRVLGNLVLAGRGDPNLERRVYRPGSEDLPVTSSSLFIEEIADQLIQQGIQRIEGDIIADTTLFLHEPYGRNWDHEDLLWEYGAASSALAVYENLYYAILSPGEASGESALIEITPRQEGLIVINGVKTIPRGQKVTIKIGRNAAGTRLTVLGKIPRQHPTLTYALSVPDPALYAAQLLKSSLEKRGVFVTGQPTTRILNPLEVLQEGKVSTNKVQQRQFKYPEHQQLFNWQSLPLSETLKILMKTSRNLYAEMLLRALGAEFSGVGSLSTGIAAVEEFLAKAGISEAQLNFSDASGLSRTNLLTPESVVRLLQYMDHHPQGQLFRESLSVAGKDGTLRQRMKGTVAEGRVLAKTGSLRFVSSLSGYVMSLHHGKLAFSIMINNYASRPRRVRQTVDTICTLMTELPGNDLLIVDPAQADH